MIDPSRDETRSEESAEVVQDACCLLNLAATDRLPEILRDLPYRFIVGPRVRAETLYLKHEHGRPSDRVDLSLPLADGSLREDALGNALDEERFLQFAAVVGNGEAEAAAIAIARGAALATDDHKVRRIVAESHPNIRLVGTLDLVQEWQILRGIPDAEVATALRRIALRASYRPRRTHPLYDWWRRLLPDL